MISIRRFARVCGFSADELRALAASAFFERLRELPEFSRKLLANIAELAYRPHGDGRKLGAAYLPELHESCGLGVDEMYALLRELEGSGFIRMEGEYPFQDVLPAGALPSSWEIEGDLVKFCAAEKLSLRDLMVELRSELLA